MGLVDAHQQDALDEALTNPRLHQPPRAITNAACGGDQDRGMRPVWGTDAPRLSEAPTLRAVHFSDRTQVVEALRVPREGPR